MQYETLQAIYDFIGEPAFEHDFDHVDYDVSGFDERAGTPGLHTVLGQVKAEPRASLLPPDLFKRFSTMPFGAIRRTFPKGCRWCEVSSSDGRDGATGYAFNVFCRERASANVNDNPRADVASRQYEHYRYPQPIEDLDVWLARNWEWYDPGCCGRTGNTSVNLTS